MRERFHIFFAKFSEIQRFSCNFPLVFPSSSRKFFRFITLIRHRFIVYIYRNTPVYIILHPRRSSSLPPIPCKQVIPAVMFSLFFRLRSFGSPYSPFCLLFCLPALVLMPAAGLLLKICSFYSSCTADSSFCHLTVRHRFPGIKFPAAPFLPLSGSFRRFTHCNMQKDVVYPRKNRSDTVLSLPDVPFIVFYPNFYLFFMCFITIFSFYTSCFTSSVCRFAARATSFRRNSLKVGHRP